MLAEAGPTLGLGHLGNRLGPPTRERPPNFGVKINIYIFLKKYIFGDIDFIFLLLYF